ncbi:MAG: MFS transporter [Sedimentisphaerales bacterium]|nr:MFS transporter [Sedimentisphaerales bacterium]
MSKLNSAPYADADQIAQVYKINRLKVMAAITLGYGFYYVCRLGLSVVKKPLIDNDIYTPEQIGNIGAALFFGYAFGKFINGFIADHVNAKKFFLFGLLLSIVCNLVMGFSNLLGLAVLAWALNGWFQSFGAACCVKSLSQWFSLHERGRYYGIWSSSHAIGEGMTFIFTSTLVSYWGWRSGFWGPAVAASIVCFGILFLMKASPQSIGLPPIADWRQDFGQKPGVYKEKNVFSTQLGIFKMPGIWVVGFASALMYVSRYAVNSWGILYFQEAKGYCLAEAGRLLGAETIVSIIGAISYGFLSDKIFNARRPPVSLIFGIIQMIALFGIFVLPINNYWMLMLFCAMFGFSIGGLMVGVGGLLAVDIAPKKAVAAALGFVGIFSYLGAALQENISGHLIGSDIMTVNHVKHYDFSRAIVFWLSSAASSTLLAATLWNVKTTD